MIENKIIFEDVSILSGLISAASSLLLEIAEQD